MQSFTCAHIISLVSVSRLRTILTVRKGNSRTFEFSNVDLDYDDGRWTLALEMTKGTRSEKTRPIYHVTKLQVSFD